MSHETLRLAREVMEALSKGDFERLLAMCDPGVEWRSFFAELGEEGVYRGHDGMRQYGDDLADAWEFVRAEPDDGVAVGDVAVLVGHIRYRGKGSGAEARDPAGWVLAFRDGKVTRFRAFRDPEEALGAIGSVSKP
jgi:ketosteroid isomerase-like protein